MAFLKSMQVKRTGNSKCLWLDRTWGIEVGDMLTIQCTLDGQTYYHTTAAKLNCSKFITLPKFWPVEIGDIIDVKISYANVPIKEKGVVKGKVRGVTEEKGDGDSGAED